MHLESIVFAPFPVFHRSRIVVVNIVDRRTCIPNAKLSVFVYVKPSIQEVPRKRSISTDHRRV